MPYNRVYKNYILYMNVIFRFGHQLRVYTVYNIIIVPILLLINTWSLLVIYKNSLIKMNQQVDIIENKGFYRTLIIFTIYLSKFIKLLRKNLSILNLIFNMQKNTM